MISKHQKTQAGASVVHFVLVLVPLLGMGSFAIDLGNLLMWQSALQRAVDAGALAGAKNLYPDNAFNPSAAYSSALSVAESNLNDENTQVTVNRGHWKFIRPEDSEGFIKRGGEFAINNSKDSSNLTYDDEDDLDTFGKFRPLFPLPSATNPESTEYLNNDNDYINAVQVTATRKTPSIFARFAGKNSPFSSTATAVAYIGFAGKIPEGKVDIPIAMCSEILSTGCTTGRLVPEGDQTGGWTDYIQPNSCSAAKVNGSSSGPGYWDLIGKVCTFNSDGSPQSSNPWDLMLGQNMQVQNGENENVFTTLYNRWKQDCSLDKDGDGLPDQSIKWTMPVVQGCKLGGNCSVLIGAVEVEVLWMILKNPSGEGENSIDKVAPKEMNTETDIWKCKPSDCDDGEKRWDDFVDHFNLKMKSCTKEKGEKVCSTTIEAATILNGGATAGTMYFHPVCHPSNDLGGTGGVNYGVHAANPVLVY